MTSTIVLPAVVLVLALAFGSGDALKCYECMAVGSANDECNGEMITKAETHKAIECSMDTMSAWYNKMRSHTDLTGIANVFEVYSHGQNQRNPQTPMACVKINLRFNNQPVVLRTCQTTKTEYVDPCKTIRDKISKSYQDHAMVEYCDLCTGDNCNGSYIPSPSMIVAMVPLLGSIIMSLVYGRA